MTGFTPNTPGAQAEFRRAVANLNRTPASKSARLNLRLQAQISKENKALRSLRRYLPGHEPDRFSR